MSSPPASHPDAFDLALVALSAGALARSAARAGLRALALDLFADADTIEHAAKTIRVTARQGELGFDPDALLAALREHAPEGLPVVLGAGFEDAPDLMGAIDRRNPLRGARPETVARLKDPFAFARLLSSLGVPHPDVTATLPASNEPAGWLSKRMGGSGGAHIRGAEGGATPGRYIQRRAAGWPLSVLFAADGRAAKLLFFSEQWADPSPEAPFRYGGAVGPVDAPSSLTRACAAALDRIVAATGLAGLASADLLAEGDAFTLLEINPRPGATLDLFDAGDMPSLLGVHLAACEGRLPASPPPPGTARAAAVFYAEAPVSVEGVARPVWTADWPSCEEAIPAGAPVCTVLAEGASPSAARALLQRRRAALAESLRPGRSPAPHSQPMVSA
jgi:predicted ATP-grasp superfamily ATP-dependent carboligase